MPNPNLKQTTSSYSVITGGQNNTISSNYTTIVGGYNSTASRPIITGGLNNNPTSNYSSIIGGRNNTAVGAYSMISSTILPFSLDTNCGIIRVKDILRTREYIRETNGYWENFNAATRLVLVEKNVPEKLYKHTSYTTTGTRNYSFIGSSL